MKKTGKSKKKETKPLRLLGKNKENFRKLLKLVEEVGDWNINYLKLSKEWGIPNQTIYNWRKKILKEMPPINPMEMGSQMISALRSSVKQCQLKVRTAATEKDRRGYMNTLAKLSDTLTDMLEKYSYKDKVPEETEISVFWKDKK